jgi:aerobic carbon-monoxide dehydrogenase medium subunit
VRNLATVGGNLAHGDHRLDAPPALLVLDATVYASSVRGERAVPVREFFTGFRQTALAPDELITAIRIPAQPPTSWGHYRKHTSLGAHDWPCAAAAVLVTDDGERCHVTGLELDAAAERVAAAVAPLLDPIPDVRGAAAYKRRVGLVTVTDALRAAWRERA